MRGLGATALQPVVTAIIQLGTVPLLLHAWGAAKYGDWLILSAIPSYLSLTDLGFGDASGSDMTIRVAAGDRKGAIETFQSSWVLLTVVSLFVGLLAAALVWNVPWHNWVRLSSLSDSQASAVVLLFGGYLLIGQQCGVFESGFRCDGNFATGTVFGTLLRLVETVLATAIGILTGSLLWAAATYLISRTVGVIIYGLLLRRRSPWLPLGLSNAKWSRIKKLAAPALGFVALPLANAISIQGFTLLIASVLGSVAVTEFSTMRTLTRVNFQLMTVIAWAMWPEMSRAFGEGNMPLARTLHRRAYQASLAVSIVTGSVLWYCGPMLYRLWIRNAVAFDVSCFHILLFVTFANSLWFTSSVVPMSTNANLRLTLIYVLLSLLSLALGWSFLQKYELRGAAFALLVTDVFMTYLVLRISLRQLQEKAGEFAGAIINVRFRPCLSEAGDLRP